MQTTTVPVSELLGSTPEETAQAKEAVVFPAFKGTNLWSNMKFEYIPLPDDERIVTVKADPNNLLINVSFVRRCNHCLDATAEHKEVMVSTDLKGVEFNPDPNYVCCLCTPCRDKANTPKKKKEQREMKYHRIAGYHRSKPSYTPEEFEEMQKQYEQNRRNASGESESVGEGTPSSASADEHVNQVTG